MNSENNEFFESLLGRLDEDSESLADNSLGNTESYQKDYIEFLTEEAMRKQRLTDEVTDYIQDLKEELKSLQWMRLFTVLLAFFMSKALFGFVAFLLIFSPEWFVKLNASFQAPLIISFIGGAVFLVSLILKGVFRTRSDRNKDEVLPEHIKTVLEVIKDQN